MKVALLWCAALVAAASLLIATDYRSRDPDSALYARISAELAQQPASQWIAPQWGGAWDQHGLFREHPVGILLPSVVLIQLGVPGAQAAYIVNMIYQAAVIALIPLLAGVVLRTTEARPLAWVLQLLPVSFAYRIRGNQEQPLLMCFLALVYGTARARTNPAWMLLVVASFCFLVLVKGAFATFALVAAALWLLLVPAPAQASDRWAWAGLVAAVLAAGVMMAGYEAIYVRTTGESFIGFYRSTRLGESIQLSDPHVIPHAIGNVGWYVLRLAWFAAPWSLAAFVVAWTWVRAGITRTSLRCVRSAGRLGDRLGHAHDRGLHRRVEPGARPRRTLHLSDVLHRRRHRRCRDDAPLLRHAPPWGTERRLPMAARGGVGRDIRLESRQQDRAAVTAAAAAACWRSKRSAGGQEL